MKDQTNPLVASVIYPVAFGKVPLNPKSPTGRRIAASVSRNQKLILQVAHPAKPERQIIKSVLLKPCKVTECDLNLPNTQNIQFEQKIVDSPANGNRDNYFLFNGRILCRIETKGTIGDWINQKRITPDQLKAKVSHALQDRDIEACIELIFYMISELEFLTNMASSPIQNGEMAFEKWHSCMDFIKDVMNILLEWKKCSAVPKEGIIHRYRVLAESFENGSRQMELKPSSMGNAKRMKASHKEDMMRLFECHFKRMKTRMFSLQKFFKKMNTVEPKALADRLLADLKNFTTLDRMFDIIEDASVQMYHYQHSDKKNLPISTYNFGEMFEVPCQFMLQVLNEFYPITNRSKTTALLALFNHLLRFHAKQKFYSIVDKVSVLSKSYIPQLKEIFATSKDLFSVCLARELLVQAKQIDPKKNEAFVLLMCIFKENELCSSILGERSWLGQLHFSVMILDTVHHKMTYSIDELVQFDNQSKRIMKTIVNSHMGNYHKENQQLVVWGSHIYGTRLTDFGEWLQHCLGHASPGNPPELGSLDAIAAIIAWMLSICNANQANQISLASCPEFATLETRHMRFLLDLSNQSSGLSLGSSYKYTKNGLATSKTTARKTATFALTAHLSNKNMIITPAMMNLLDKAPRYTRRTALTLLAFHGVYLKSDLQKPFKIFARMLTSESFHSIAPDDSKMEFLVKETQFQGMIKEFLGVSILEVPEVSGNGFSVMKSWRTMYEEFRILEHCKKIKVVQHLFLQNIMIYATENPSSSSCSVVYKAVKIFNESFTNFDGSAASDFSSEGAKSKEDWNSWMLWSAPFAMEFPKILYHGLYHTKDFIDHVAADVTSALAVAYAACCVNQAPKSFNVLEWERSLCKVGLKAWPHRSVCSSCVALLVLTGRDCTKLRSALALAFMIASIVSKIVKDPSKSNSRNLCKLKNTLEQLAYNDGAAILLRNLFDEACKITLNSFNKDMLYTPDTPKGAIIEARKGIYSVSQNVSNKSCGITVEELRTRFLRKASLLRKEFVKSYEIPERKSDTTNTSRGEQTEISRPRPSEDLQRNNGSLEPDPRESLNRESDQIEAANEGLPAQNLTSSAKSPCNFEPDRKETASEVHDSLLVENLTSSTESPRNFEPDRKETASEVHDSLLVENLTSSTESPRNFEPDRRETASEVHDSLLVENLTSSTESPRNFEPDRMETTSEVHDTLFAENLSSSIKSLRNCKPSRREAEGEVRDSPRAENPTNYSESHRKFESDGSEGASAAKGKEQVHMLHTVSPCDMESGRMITVSEETSTSLAKNLTSLTGNPRNSEKDRKEAAIEEHDSLRADGPVCTFGSLFRIEPSKWVTLGEVCDMLQDKDSSQNEAFQITNYNQSALTESCSIRNKSSFLDPSGQSVTSEHQNFPNTISSSMPSDQNLPVSMPFIVNTSTSENQKFSRATSSSLPSDNNPPVSMPFIVNSYMQSIASLPLNESSLILTKMLNKSKNSNSEGRPSCSIHNSQSRLTTPPPSVSNENQQNCLTSHLRCHRVCRTLKVLVCHRHCFKSGPRACHLECSTSVRRELLGDCAASARSEIPRNCSTTYVKVCHLNGSTKITSKTHCSSKTSK
ncbi:uncharacterized protein LOC108666095 isoform X2 [Hyalella azteca]|uniref:Uncharacterized protein LOC108666095 isoform X2 n=1 Tax=Hyalella azteca TaxID=294128 RepID=A0A979FG28_HYAAZ|nr:uncharacterized protein LOC108666095 isoform X2 [Hyalella azteca]